MSWLLGLALKAGGFVAASLKAFAKWLGEDLRHVLIATLALIAIGAAWTARENGHDRDEAMAQRYLWQDAAKAEREARLSLIAAVELARKAAAEADAANAARVEHEMAVNTERTANEYEARLADRDAAYRSLQHDLALSARTGDGDGGGGDEGVPGDLTARCKALGAADCDDLLASLPGILAEAEGNTAKLIALQDWVRGVLEIDLSGESAAIPVAADVSP